MAARSDAARHRRGAPNAAAIRTASPWDMLLQLPPERFAERAEHRAADVRGGTKLAGLLAVLAEVDSITTLSLAARTDLTERQVWGLLKAPRAVGQVRFADGRWQLVRGFAGRDVERAAALLRARGWTVEPPEAPSI